ncbi:MAG TPA: S8 family serine peptidase, partial [Chloroflexia bacterium]|nr:S8 family serine peptidase [Chloroflexia bacterium]
MSTREPTHALRPNIRVLMALALLVLAMMALGSGGSSSAARAAAPTVPGANSAQPAGKIDPFVSQDLAGDGSASLVIRMADKADLRAAYGMKDHDARGWYVYNTLRDHAARTQTGVRAFLDARGVSYESYWGANVIIAEGNRELVEVLATRTDVERIESNRPFRGIDPIQSDPSDKSGANSPDGAIGIAWGVQNVRAPEVWAMGYRGAGIVIGNQDTGMRWTHVAIKDQYRGWNGATANHNYNWWDGLRVPGDLPTNPCGYSTNEPCDDDELLGGGHGTHTTGTVLGDDGMGNQVGVAPEATWMGCRNMERGVGRPQTYMECFEFFLAPHDLEGNNPDPTKRPHVMNNSWICVEGCAPNTLQDLVEASQASCIFVEVSAGNDGPTCSTIQFPPQIYEASFDTGSITVDEESGLPILSDFSSRGPVLSDGSMRIKPNVVAPGEDIPSALRGSDTEYGNLDGTSMAGPHTVGVVALIWSARPELVRQITETKVLLQLSANPDVHVVDPIQECGGTTEADIPNNHFGYGRVDAFAALQRAQGIEPTATAILASPTPGTPTATPTACPIQFADVPANHTFYASVRCLS